MTSLHTTVMPHPIMTILDLNDDCLRIMIDHLSMADLINLCLTCKDLKTITSMGPRLSQHQSMVRDWSLVSMGKTTSLDWHEKGTHFNKAGLLLQEIRSNYLIGNGLDIANYIKHLHFTDGNFWSDFERLVDPLPNLRHITLPSLEDLLDLATHHEYNVVAKANQKKVTLSLMEDTSETGFEKHTWRHRDPNTMYLNAYRWSNTDGGQGLWEHFGSMLNRINVHKVEIVRGRCTWTDIRLLVRAAELEYLRYTSHDKHGPRSLQQIYNDLGCVIRSRNSRGDWRVDLVEVGSEQELHINRGGK